MNLLARSIRRRTRYRYDPFGIILESSGPMAEMFRFRFSTKYHEPVSGLVLYQKRAYCPELGRWLSRDPIGEDGGLNLYAFCGNNPVDRFDALGYSPDVNYYEDGVASVVIKKCNIIIYVGHNNTVPQGRIGNECGSAAAVVSCGKIVIKGLFGRRVASPAIPDIPIPGYVAPKPGQIVLHVEAMRQIDDLFESAKRYAQQQICKDKQVCCRSVKIKVETNFGLDVVTGLLYGPLGYGYSGKNETINCNR